MARPTKPNRTEEDRKSPARRASTDAPAASKRTLRGEPPRDEATYGEFLELTSDGVWRYDVVPSVSIRLPAEEQAQLILSRARLGFCNLAFARLYGFGDPKDLPNLPLSNLLAGTDEEKLRFVAESVATGYRFANVEVVTRDRDGRSLRTLNNVTGVVKRGRLVGGWGTSRDVSAQREAEAALEDAHADLRATLAALPDLVFEVDGEGRIFQYHAPDPERLYATPAEFLGKRVSDVLPADAARVIQDALGEAAQYGSHHGAKYSLSLPDGRRWFELSMARKGQKQGSQARYVAIARDVTAQEEAAAAVRSSEQRLALALDATSDGIYDVDFATGITHYSPRYATMLGYEPEELSPSQETWEGLLHPDDREEALRQLAECLGGETDAYEMEFRLRAKSGEWRWILSRGKVVARTADGRALRLIGTHRDITQRVNARQALRASEEKYRLLVENAGEAIFVAQDGVLKFANSVTGRMLGREVQDLVGQPFANLIHPDDRDMVISRHLRRTSGEEGIEQGYTFRVIHGDGSVHWVEINAVRIEWEGSPATLNFAADVTERRASEEARRENEERFRQIFDESPIGMVTAGPDYRFTRANEVFCRMIGYSEDELLKLRFVDITHPDHVSQDLDGVQRAGRGEIPAYRTEKRYVRKDGRVVWGSAASSPMRGSDGRVQYFLAMIEDITAAKEARAALDESERRFREMANALPTCVFEAGLDGRVTYANQTGLEWFGYAEDEIVGSRSVFDMVAPEQRDVAARTFRTAAETGGVPAGEYTALRKDGTSFPALVSSRAIVRDGKTIGVRGVLIDISERVKAAQQVERAFTGTIHALALTTEVRDPYTAGHQERVTRLAVAIGRRLDLSAGRLEGLRVAGLLHDVGKVSVPAEILSKPTELSAIEMGLVRSHSETGYAILREIDFQWPIATIVLQHHERMDGSGYPSGLRGDEILLEARILAVADTVEAMASHRPYRAAFGIDYALAEVERGCVTAYDRAVASACLAVFAEDGFRFDA